MKVVIRALYARGNGIGCGVKYKCINDSYLDCGRT